ncbi:MAG: hypothetical protein HFH68_14345 [Lachnospiraceae bacterium]|nr:hypothetical protein [Lachnospiraceae bacterium]
MFLLELISNMEENHKHFVKNPRKDFSRNRKLTFSKTLFLIICMKAQTLKKELLKIFKFVLMNYWWTVTSNSFNYKKANIILDNNIIITYNYIKNL